MAEDVADASGLHWSEDRTFFDGKRYLYGLVADPETVYAEVTVGDVLGIGLLFENSYDGSRKLGASLYIHRLVCANGMLAPSLLARVRFRHSRGSVSWRGEVAQALAMLGAVPRSCAGSRHWRRAWPVTSWGRRNWRRSASGTWRRCPCRSGDASSTATCRTRTRPDGASSTRRRRSCGISTGPRSPTTATTRPRRRGCQLRPGVAGARVVPGAVRSSRPPSPPERWTPSGLSDTAARRWTGGVPSACCA